PESFDGEALAAFVRANADDIYRVKGTLTDEFFDFSTAGVTRTPQPGAKPALAWIVRGGALEKITAGLASL
ncbi:MAG TPA: hypothetical protein VJ904_05945, partial [Tichowtungia sp.]|nr:hypothetical protein [Tichowtungia sp.]